MRETRSINRASLSAILGLMLLICPLVAKADNARDWQNLPANLDMFFGYYNRIDSNTSIDTTLPMDGLSLKANLYILRYARSFGIAGRSSAFQILQPIADLKASFNHAKYFTGEKSNNGIADTQFVFVHNIFGGPALSKEEFSRWTPETFLTPALWITAPTGDYDKKKVINIGANRWVIKPEIAFGYPIGASWLELNTWISFYTDNTEYFGNKKLKQDPLYSVEGHYSYSFNRALWASLDATYSTGGTSKVDGVSQNNRQETTLAGATIGFMLSPQFGGLVAYSDTVAKRSGSPDVETWTLRLQYLW